MKKFSPAFVLIASFVILFFSCKKINEPTSLGSDLIPPVDNVNTFDTTLDVNTFNLDFNDTTTTLYTDNVAVGHINDPVFGTSHADAYFDISRPAYGTYPFLAKKDSIFAIDSVVLSLSYKGGYGDTASALTVNISEIDQNSGFNDTTFYRYNSNTDFAPSGPVLGSKTFIINKLSTDSFTVKNPGDTVTRKLINVLRIRLDTTLIGRRFVNFDTINQYKNDSNFKKAFKGFAVKSATNGRGFAFFNFSEQQNTKLIIYYRARINGRDSASMTEFYHLPVIPAILSRNPANFRNGQANSITRTYSGTVQGTFNTIPDPTVYIQSAPGTYARIVVPGLSTFPNKVIHRAEIIAPKIPSAEDNIFTSPVRMILDKISPNRDTAYLLDKDLVPSFDGSLGFEVFGGRLQSDNTYRFNITRHVQGIVTRHERNDTLRLYAPLRTTLFAPSLGTSISVPVLSTIATGRVVIGGGNNLVPTNRLRLRIIYSNL